MDDGEALKVAREIAAVFGKVKKGSDKDAAFTEQLAFVSPARRAMTLGSSSLAAGPWRAGRPARVAVGALVCGLAWGVFGASAGAQDPPATSVVSGTFRGSALAEATGAASRASPERTPITPQVTFELPAPTAAGPATMRRKVAGVPGSAGVGGGTSDGMRPKLQIGIGRDLGGPDVAALRWVPLADGGLAAALSVASGSARSVRLQLRIRGAPAGLAMRVYDPQSPAATVAAIPRRQLADDAEVTVWTPTVAGEEAAVELYLPPGVSQDGLEVGIPRLSHLAVDPTRISDIGNADCPHVDVACAADRVSDVTRRAVAKYTVTNQFGDSYYCTGTLLNDTDPSTQTPYFLTARHCVVSAAHASSMEFYWFFERIACGGSAPRAVTRQAGGATVLVADAANPTVTGVDHVLLRLNTDPPVGVGLAGWTTEDVSAGETATLVHHPAGDLKVLTSAQVVGLTGWRLDGGQHTVVAGGSSHIEVVADVSIEGGSSGSGMWKRIDGDDYLVGVATGRTPAGCRDGTGYYGRFALFYPHASPWLGPVRQVEDGEFPRVRRLVLVDGATGAEVADLTAGDVSVDLDATGVRSFNVVAELAETAAGVGSVRLRLTGALQAQHEADLAPFTLFGHRGGAGLTAGAYTVTAAAFSEPGAAGVALGETAAAFTVTGEAGSVSVAGLALAVGGRPRVVDLEDGAAVTVYQGEDLKIRARTAGGAGSVTFSLTGASTSTVTANGAPFSAPVSLVSGTYGIEATPYAGAQGGGDAGTALAVSGVEVTVLARPVSGFTVVDAAGGLPDPDLGPVADGGTVDLSSTDGWASLRAEVTPGAAVSRVVLDLDGPRRATRSEAADGPMSLFGERDGDYAAAPFPNGAYTLTARPFAGDDPRDVLPVTTTSFTVTGGVDRPIVGFVLVAADGGPPDPDLGAIEEGATISLAGTSGSWVNVRADVLDADAVGSVRFELRGPVSVTNTDSAQPYSLFGDRDGDYEAGALPDGDYRLTARPFEGAGGTGAALRPLTVSFSITDSDRPPTLVTGFTLIDAAGGLPDPDIGPIEPGGVVRLGEDPSAGSFSIRADLSSLVGVGSVRLRLSGPRSAVRVEDNDDSPFTDTDESTPFTLFGDRRNGDVQGESLPAGRYRIEAQPYAARGAKGVARTPQSAVFYVTSSWVGRLVLVDAATGAEVADLTAGDVSVDLDATDVRSFNVVAQTPAGVGSVRLRLTGALQAQHEADLTPFTLFGHRGGAGLTAGAYTVTATAFSEPGATGVTLGETAAAFTVTGDAGNVSVAGLALAVGSGPRVVDLEDGAAVTVYQGEPVTIRARTGGGAGSVTFSLTGASTSTVTANGAPFSAPVSLVSGTYGIEATPHAGAQGGGDAGTALAVSGVEVTVLARPVSGFTLVDAVGGLPDPDLGPVADGGTVDLSSTDGWASLRAEVTPGATVSRVALDLDGPRRATRSEAADGPLSLFGERDGDYAAGALPNGAYTLTVRAFASDDPRDVLPVTTTRFTVTGAPDVSIPIGGFVLVDADGGPPDPDLRVIEEGATISLAGTSDSWVSVRADVVNPDAVGKVRFELRGPVSVTNTDSAQPYSLFGDRDGDYEAGALPDGDYRLTAQPFEPAGGAGVALGPLTVSFSITDSDRPPTLVSGFTLIDAAGGPPDPDIGPIEQDGTIYLEDPSAGSFSIRADLSSLVDVRSVRLRLSGPSSSRYWRDEMNDGSPFTLLGDNADNGDVSGRSLPVGRYNIEAQPYTAPHRFSFQTVARTPQSAVFHVVSMPPLTASIEGMPADHDGTTAFTFELQFSEEVDVGAAELRGDAFDVVGGEVSHAHQMSAPGTRSWRVTIRPGAGDVTVELRGERACDTSGAICMADGRRLSHDLSLTVRAGTDLTRPAVTVSAVTAAVAEGSPAVFTLTRTGDAASALAAAVSVTESGAMLAGVAPTEAVFAAGAGTATVSVATVDDAVDEPASTVTAVVSVDGRYTLGWPHTAQVVVEDNDLPPSTDASLSALVLTGIDIGAFDAQRTGYTADVAHDVESTTVRATPSDARAGVVITDARGSTSGTVRSSRLAEGDNAISVAVTAEDGETVRTYRVTVTRAPWPVPRAERQPGRDIDLSAAEKPRGLASDGETLWAADWDTGRVVAYTLSDGARRESRDFGLGSYLVSALYTDGQTLWAADYEGGVYAYRLSGRRAAGGRRSRCRDDGGRRQRAADGSVVRRRDHVGGGQRRCARVRLRSVGRRSPDRPGVPAACRRRGVPVGIRHVVRRRDRAGVGLEPRHGARLWAAGRRAAKQL